MSKLELPKRPIRSDLARSFGQIDIPIDQEVLGKSTWDKAERRRFFIPKDELGVVKFPPIYVDGQSSNMETALTYIYMNTLRWEIHQLSKMEVDRTTCPWTSDYDDNTPRGSHLCPAPWKFRTLNYRDNAYAVFYLPALQIEENYAPTLASNSPIDNYTLIRNPNPTNGRIQKNKAKSPSLMLNASNANKKRHSMVEIDHLLRNDKYLIELPSELHVLKTRYLDPFNVIPTKVTRAIMHGGIYWQHRNEWLWIHNEKHPEEVVDGVVDRDLDNVLRIGQCLCEQVIQPIQNGVTQEHVHERHFQDKWGANMQDNNLS